MISKFPSCCASISAFIENRADQDLEVASEFLEMAARLVHIKTVMLLPRHEEEADDLKAKLTGELMEYRICRLAGFRVAAAGAGASGFHPQARRYSGGYDLPPEPSRFAAAGSCGRGYRTGGAPAAGFPRAAFSGIVRRRVVSVGSRIIHLMRRLYAHPDPWLLASFFPTSRTEASWWRPFLLCLN